MPGWAEHRPPARPPASRLLCSMLSYSTVLQQTSSTLVSTRYISKHVDVRLVAASGLKHTTGRPHILGCQCGGLGWLSVWGFRVAVSVGV